MSDDSGRMLTLHLIPITLVRILIQSRLVGPDLRCQTLKEMDKRTSRFQSRFRAINDVRMQPLRLKEFVCALISFDRNECSLSAVNVLLLTRSLVSDC